MCPSNETSSPRATVVTSSPTTSTVPAISCPWMRGGLILPSDHASQSKMWRSVPQIAAIPPRPRASPWRVARPHPRGARGAPREVPGAEDEALGADRAHDELRRRVAVEEGQEARLVEVLRDRRAAEHGIDPEERLLEA